jgi:hypothetical protein
MRRCPWLRGNGSPGKNKNFSSMRKDEEVEEVKEDEEVM